MKKLDVPQSGSQANTTASRNRFGQYDRTRAVPVNPNSARQSLSRSRLSELSVAWRALSDAERISWNEYGSAHPRTDSLGQTVAPTGHQSFVGVNSGLVNAGLAQVTAPPVDIDLPAPELVLTVAASPTFSVAFAPTPLSGGAKMVIQASPSISAGRSFNGDYRFIQASAADAVSPVNIAAAYAAKFGALASGLRVFVRAYVILPSGQRSVGVVVSKVIA